MINLEKCDGFSFPLLNSYQIQQQVFDNLPESLQYAEKGDQMTEAIDEMESIIAELSDLKDRLYAFKASPVKSQKQ